MLLKSKQLYNNESDVKIKNYGIESTKLRLFSWLICCILAKLSIEIGRHNLMSGSVSQQYVKENTGEEKARKKVEKERKEKKQGSTNSTVIRESRSYFSISAKEKTKGNPTTKNGGSSEKLCSITDVSNSGQSESRRRRQWCATLSNLDFQGVSFSGGVTDLSRSDFVLINEHHLNMRFTTRSPKTGRFCGRNKLPKSAMRGE